MRAHDQVARLLLTGNDPTAKVGRSPAWRVWAAVAFILCLVAFAALAALVRQPGIPTLDSSTTSLLHTGASPTLDDLVTAVTGLGSTLVLAVVAGIAAAALVSRGHPTVALFVVVALVGSVVLNNVLKAVIGRPRPPFEWSETLATASFPSGHTMNAFVVYLAIALAVWHLWGRRVGTVAVAAAVLISMVVGTSRIYLGVHWLTDVVGGFLAGAMCLLLVVALFAASDRQPRAMASASPREAPPDGS